MRAVLIPERGDPREVQVGGYEDLRECVGGWVESLPIPGRNDAVAFGNEEAKLIGMEENERATRLLIGDKAAMRRRMEADRAAYEERGVAVVTVGWDDPREPYIAGPVVVVGFDPDRGENLPIPDDLAAGLLGESQ